MLGSRQPLPLSDLLVGQLGGVMQEEVAASRRRPVHPTPHSACCAPWCARRSERYGRKTTSRRDRRCTRGVSSVDNSGMGCSDEGRRRQPPHLAVGSRRWEVFPRCAVCHSELTVSCPWPSVHQSATRLKRPTRQNYCRIWPCCMLLDRVSDTIDHQPTPLYVP